jgi:hypothetical protein
VTGSGAALSKPVQQLGNLVLGNHESLELVQRASRAAASLFEQLKPNKQSDAPDLVEEIVPTR